MSGQFVTHVPNQPGWQTFLKRIKLDLTDWPPCEYNNRADMEKVRNALKMQREAQRKRLLAPENDPIWREFDLRCANDLEHQSTELLRPTEPLETGAGGEIIPPPSSNLPGLETVLQEPDLLNLAASSQRMDLVEKAGVLELALETSHLCATKGPVQKMLTHQLAAAHKRALELMGESAQAKDPDIACKKAKVAAKMMDAFSRAALTLQRLQTGASQVVTVQHVQINGPAVVGNFTN